MTQLIMTADATDVADDDDVTDYDNIFEDKANLIDGFADYNNRAILPMLQNVSSVAHNSLNYTLQNCHKFSHVD